MKKIILNTTIILILILLYLASSLLINNTQKDRPTQAHTFTFSLPIPADVCKRFKVEPLPIVKSVYLAGSFSGWSSDDEHYRMTPAPGKAHSWSISLDPGNTQYKFVVYIEGRDDPVWVHDTTNPRKTPDGFEGYNSLYRINIPLSLLRLVQHILLLLLLSTAVIMILTTGLTLLFKAKLSSSTLRAIIIVVSLVSLSLLLTLINTHTLRESTKQGYIQVAHTLDQLIQSEILDLHNIQSAQDKETIQKILNSQSGNKEFVNIFLLDPELELILQAGKNNIPADPDQASRFIRKVLFHSFIQPEKDKVYRISQAGFAQPSRDYYQISDHGSPLSARIPGYQVMLYPLKVNNSITAYLGFVIDPKEQVVVVIRSILLHISWIIIMTTLLIILLIKHTGSQSHSSKDARHFYETYKITDREKDIIELMVKGAHNQDIAGKLFISEKTVKSHIYNIYQKAGIQNRVELINKINGENE